MTNANINRSPLAVSTGTSSFDHCDRGLQLTDKNLDVWAQILIVLLDLRSLGVLKSRKQSVTYRVSRLMATFVPGQLDATEKVMAHLADYLDKVPR